jgi:flagellar biosynthesis protein FlhF
VQYQSFRGADVQQALSAVKAALGPDALIESTRRVSNGRGGALGQTFVEITAAAASEEGLRRRLQPARQQQPARRGWDNNTPRDGLTPETPRTPQPAPRAQAESAPGLDAQAIQRELHALRGMLEELNAARPVKERAVSMLNAVGIEGVLAKELSVGAARIARKGNDALRSWLMGRVADRVRVVTSPITRPGRQVIACVGQTGVGKTTTLAKLAARARLDLGRSVGVITLDTFRVGAVEQWQRYAALLGLPLGVAHTREEFARLMAESRSEIVLVDTAGRGNVTLPGTCPLATCLADVTDRERNVLLVTPAWLRARDAESVLEQYAHPAPTGLVVTKLDETLHVGGVMHASLPNALPITYLCDGPRVPEDIHDASIDIVLDALFSSQP